MFQFLPAIGGMLEGLLGSGAASGAAGAAGGMMGGGATGGGIANVVGQGANEANAIGLANSTPNIATLVGQGANEVSKMGTMPSVGGLTSSGQNGPALPGLMQAQAPGHQNDPLMQGGGMFQKIFGGGI